MGVLIRGLPALHRYRFRFVADEPILLPPMPGSAWRGLLGHGLRRTVCVTRQSTCDGCLLQQSCIHNRLFESDSAESGRYRKRPHPFVLEVEPTSHWREIPPGETLVLGITLFGPVREALPYLIQSFLIAGRKGLGRTRGRFSLVAVDALPGLADHPPVPVWRGEGGVNTADVPAAAPPPVPERVTVELLTPLRFKVKGRLVGPREFSGELFLRALWRRARDVGRFYGELQAGTLPDEPPEGIEALRPELQWHDWRRFSSRQKEYMKMGGIVGSFRLSGSRLASWWPLLWYGQWLHVGKVTSMGLGRYRIAGGEAAVARDASEEAGALPLRSAGAG